MRWEGHIVAVGSDPHLGPVFTAELMAVGVEYVKVTAHFVVNDLPLHYHQRIAVGKRVGWTITKDVDRVQLGD